MDPSDKKVIAIGTGIFLVSSVPFLMQLRHFYYPYNQQQLDFRRIILGIPFWPDKRSTNPGVFRSFLQFVGVSTVLIAVFKRPIVDRCG